jgi:hypothetical protein
MNGRAIGALVATLVVVALVAFALLIRPNTGEVADLERRRPTVPVDPVRTPPSPVAPPVDAPPVAAAAAPATEDAPASFALPDRPDEPIDPMMQYPLSRQGMEGAFAEMQIEFDTCRRERDVTLPPSIEVVMTVRRTSPPHEEYGIEEGEVFGMVHAVEVVGADPAAVQPFTDCVQEQLFDLLFDAPAQDVVRITWPMRFTAG